MIKNKIEKLLLSTLPPNTDLKREKKLITNGFLDSFSILVLIANIEQEFKIKIDMEKFTTRNFESMKSIEQYIKKNL